MSPTPHTLTPELLISTLRRGPAIPNSDGTLALFSSSTHEIGVGTSKSIHVLDLSNGQSRVVIEDDKAHDPQWLPHTTNGILYLRTGEKGCTEILVVDIAEPSSCSPALVAVARAPVSCLKLVALDNRAVGLAVVGLVDSDGDLYNEEAAAKKKSSVKVFDDFRVRCWNTYMAPKRHSICYARLKIKSSGIEMGNFHNAIPQANLSAPCGMYPGATPGSSNFAISSRGIVFAAADPETTNPLHADVSNLYFVRIRDWGKPAKNAPQKIAVHGGTTPAQVDTRPGVSRKDSHGCHVSGLGYCSDPRFSPDGRSVAFLRCTYERQQDIRLMVADGKGFGQVRDVFKDITQTQWDLVPTGIEYGTGNDNLLVTAQDHGRVTLHRLWLEKGAMPEVVVGDGAVTTVLPLGKREEGMVLVSGSNLTDISTYQVADTLGPQEVKMLSSATDQGAAIGVSRDQVHEMNYKSSNGYDVHAWLVTPPGFDPKNKRYPLALLIHGGPPSASRDWWDTKWNLLAWAAQGFVVVAPNILGSVGFGLKLTEGIYGNWRDGPYQDLVDCMAHLESLPYVDLDRAIAAGWSFGGYMVYTLMGRPLGRKFKAMVAHEGIFNLPAMMLQSDYRGLRESGMEHFLGPIAPWNSASFAAMQACNPARPELLAEWVTPLLIVHNDLDYIVPVTEGLAAFNVCQMKGIPSRLVTFKDEGHHVLKEENSLEWHRLVFEWVNRWTKNDGILPRSS